MSQTWQINIDRADKALIDLAKAMIAQHKADGQNSALIGYDTDALEDKIAEAEAFLKESQRKHDEAMVATQSKDLSIGKAEGQNSKTEGTLLWFVYTAKSKLLSKFRGKERMLALYGLTAVPTRNNQSPDNLYDGDDFSDTPRDDGEAGDIGIDEEGVS